MPAIQRTALEDVMSELITSCRPAMPAIQNTALEDVMSELIISCRQVTQPFPFSQLPFELRYKIYVLCLTSKTSIDLTVDQHPGWAIYESRRRIYDLMNHGPLDLPIYSWHDSTINTGLLQLNRSTYDEAIPVLYGHNFFRFPGWIGWITFSHFHYRLTESSRRHLRSLQFAFLDFYQDYPSKAIDDSLTILKGLPHLNSLTLQIYCDMSGWEVMLLQQIRDSCQHGCQVKLDIWKPNNSIGYSLLRLRCQRRISSSVLRKIQEWNWTVSGSSFETIDDSSG